MAFQFPAGFGHYREVLARLGHFRAAGKWVQFQCPFGETRHRHGDRNWSGLAWIGHAGELVARCLGCGAGWKELAAEIGTRPADWFPDKGRSRDQKPRRRMKAKLVATYIYRDREGEYLYEKQRFEPGFDGRDKSLRFRRPLPARFRKQCKVPDGVESWVYGIMGDEYGRSCRDGCWDWYPVRTHKEAQESIVMDGCEPVLYRWPEMATADVAAPVLVVEGEKDVEILRALGFVAVCGPNGASSWLDAWSLELEGRRVCVIPDHNRVGYQHADAATGSLLRAGVGSLRVVMWDDADGNFHPGEGGGVGNWLAIASVGKTRTHVRNMVAELCKRAWEYSRPRPVETIPEAA